MNDKDMFETEEKPANRPHKRMIDFVPRAAAGSSSHTPRDTGLLSEAEKRRHEIAKKEVQRREEIHRQIEVQKEHDIIMRRREIAARQDLARRIEMEKKENEEALAAHERELMAARERGEIARKRALIERRARFERQRAIAERRAKQARAELARRREMEIKPRVEVKDSTPENIPEKEAGVERRLGSVEDFEAELNDLETAAELIEAEENENVEAMMKDNRPNNFLEDIGNVSVKKEKVKKKPENKIEEEDSSKNNDRYVLGGYSPFINTEVEKRPLSGGTKTLESTAHATRKPAGRYVPYEEPIPHKNIYERSLAKEKKNGKDVPTMVVGEASKGSKVSLIIAIALTIILGATVGAIAYLAIFQ